MAVTKTPRKKPASIASPEEVAPVKAAPAKKAATKKAAVVAPEAKPEAAVVTAPAKKTKAPAKAKAPKVEPSVEPAVVEASAVVTPEPAPAPAPPAPVRVAPVRTPVPVQLDPIVATILAAISEGRALEFIFADADANAPRTFEPRSLSFDALSQAWFVWGWDRRYNAERHHRVELLAEANEVEGVGRAAQGPYADGTPANQIGGWLGGEPIAVKASLMKQWVFAVKQAPPAFPGFKLEDQSDGQALVSFAATDLRAIARWAMQFGDGIQVLEPARLADRIKQVGAVWAGRERLAAAAPAPRPAPRQEAAPEPRRHESRPPREARPDREPRHDRDRDRSRDRDRDQDRDEASKGKAKVEVLRFDRL